MLKRDFGPKSIKPQRAGYGLVALAVLGTDHFLFLQEIQLGHTDSPMHLNMVFRPKNSMCSTPVILHDALGPTTCFLAINPIIS